MKNKKKYIKIFALTILFVISISLNAGVKAETNYYDDNGVMYRLIFDDTQLKNFVQRDFALYYNEKDMQNKDIAKLQAERTDGYGTHTIAFAKDKRLNIEIYETTQNWQQSHEEKYIAIILADYMAGTKKLETKMYENHTLRKFNNGKYTEYADYYRWENNYGENLLNFDKNNNEVKSWLNFHIGAGSGFNDLVIIVNKDGTIRRITNFNESYNELYAELNYENKNEMRKNLIYSSMDIYNESGTEIIKPKEDFEQRKDVIVEKEIKVNPDESNKINFKIFNLKKNDKIKIIKKDKSGNYTENDIIEKTITIDLNENQSYLIKDENVKENKIYDIKIYDSKNKIIYQEEYIHSMKNYVLEDKTEEKNKLINLEDYKINNKVANLIKNVFIIGNNEYLGKLIFLVFTITIITIIRKMV